MKQTFFLSQLLFVHGVFHTNWGQIRKITIQFFEFFSYFLHPSLKNPGWKSLPQGGSFQKWLCIVAEGSINLGHTQFEINTAHRCIETQRQKSKLGKFHLFLFFGENKRAEWSLETGNFCDFSVWLNLKWGVTGPRSLRANEKLTVHCYRTELNPISGKRLGNILIEEAWSTANNPSKTE